MPEIKQHVVSAANTVRDALKALNSLSGGNLTLFVVNEENALIGSLTDGDIRRALTSGFSLDDPLADVCHRNCLRIDSDSQRWKVAAKARKLGISLLPIVDDMEVIVDIADMSQLKALLPLDAVLMAGGRGERLRPLTLSTPKPLLEVGGRPIIDYNVEALLLYGVESVNVTVNYLKEQFFSHFSSPVEYGGRRMMVNCVEEPCRLGTMGSLALVDSLSQENLLVMNSDLLTDVDFAAMFDRHLKTNADLTMGVFPYRVNVPFAVAVTAGEAVKSLVEKPSYNYLANAGVYMMKSEVAQDIPKGEYLDAPDLINDLMAAGRKVSFYQIEGTWIDIGSPADFERANALLAQNNPAFD